MEAIEIVQAKPEEVASLQVIARQTFAEAFLAGNTADNMEQYMNEAFSTARLSRELSDRLAVFYFALAGERVIGYLKLNYGQSQTELQDSQAVEIERIYVLKEFHGQQVGQLLCEKAIELAKAADASYVWLGVWEENPRAIRFYEKNGFIAFDKHIFKLGDDEQTDIMMKCTLKG